MSTKKHFASKFKIFGRETEAWSAPGGPSAFHQPYFLMRKCFFSIFRTLPTLFFTTFHFCNYCKRHAILSTKGGVVRRDAVLLSAKVKKEKGDPPAQPHGCNFVDFDVQTIVQGQPLVIKTSKSITLRSHQLFPIVEGFFGPLRIPLPATSAALDAEYGESWRYMRAGKRLGEKSGVGKHTDVLESHLRHCIHPSVPLEGCPSYLGCYSGASCDASATDIPWRWL